MTRPHPHGGTVARGVVASQVRVSKLLQRKDDKKDGSRYTAHRWICAGCGEAVEMVRNGDLGMFVPDYVDENVGNNVVRIVQSYVGAVNKMV